MWLSMVWRLRGAGLMVPPGQMARRTEPRWWSKAHMVAEFAAGTTNLLPRKVRFAIVQADYEDRVRRSGRAVFTARRRVRSGATGHRRSSHVQRHLRRSLSAERAHQGLPAGIPGEEGTEGRPQEDGRREDRDPPGHRRAGGAHRATSPTASCPTTTSTCWAATTRAARRK